MFTAKAVTLMEVLVAALILSFVLTGTAIFLQTSAELSRDVIMESSAQNNLNLVYNDIVREVKSARAVRASNSSRDTLELIKADSTHVSYWFNKAEGRILKKISGGTFKPLINITAANQVCSFDCSFTNDSSFMYRVVMIEKLVCRVEDKKSGKVFSAGLSGRGSGTSIACRNE